MYNFTIFLQVREAHWCGFTGLARVIYDNFAKGAEFFGQQPPSPPHPTAPLGAHGVFGRRRHEERCPWAHPV